MADEGRATVEVSDDVGDVAEESRVLSKAPKVDER